MPRYQDARHKAPIRVGQMRAHRPAKPHPARYAFNLCTKGG